MQWDPNEPGGIDLAGPEGSATQHARWALGLTWEDVFPLALNPCLKWAFLDQHELLGYRLCEWRNAVSKDVCELVREVREDQEEWLQLAPDHVQQAYKQGSQTFVVQLLPFAVLLQLFEFPEWEQLVCDMFHGFRMLGPLTPGSAWQLRTDAKYARPIGFEQFKAFNAAHARTLVHSVRSDEHTDQIRSEVEREAKLGRFRGPWPRECLRHVQQPLQQTENTCEFAAKAFPIVQGDKVRRGDDWLRSGHNSTVWASDTPPYSGTATIIAAVRYCARKSSPHLAAVDHEGAYRSLPVRDPRECCTVLPGEPEGSVWQHTVLPFGATGSVWAYLRVADAFCFLSIVLLWLAAAHFVDDFFMVEGSELAPVGFKSFHDIHAALGFRMKKAKEKPPAAQQTLLGVEWSVGNECVLASAGSERIRKIQLLISQILASGEMSQQMAAKLAGKLGFVTSWVFGQVGKALLKPLYARQHGLPGSSALSKSMRVALLEIQGVLPLLKPVQIPLQVGSQSVSILYADAFITLSGVRRTARKWLSNCPSLSLLKDSENGWGALFFGSTGIRRAFQSKVPVDSLAKVVQSKAFIYWLEMMAQILSIAVIAPHVQGHLVCFVDNTAAEHALRKGYSKDESFTKTLACFWAWVADKNLQLSFHRVTSAANLSDGISRGNWDDAEAFGCQRLCPQFERVYKFFLAVQKGEHKELRSKFSKLVGEIADYKPAHKSGEQRA